MDEETPAYVCDMSLCPPSGVKRTQAVHTRHDSDVPARPPDCLVSRVDRTFSGRHRMAENAQHAFHLIDWQPSAEGRQGLLGL